MEEALQEFYRVLHPGGILAADFVNRHSHYTLARKHLFRERIDQPEYASFAEFEHYLDAAGFMIEEHIGFDYKLCQGYLFMSRFRPVIDPASVQERISRFLERREVPAWPGLAHLGYRIYVRCKKDSLDQPEWHSVHRGGAKARGIIRYFSEKFNYNDLYNGLEQ